MLGVDQQLLAFPDLEPPSNSIISPGWKISTENSNWFPAPSPPPAPQWKCSSFIWPLFASLYLMFLSGTCIKHLCSDKWQGGAVSAFKIAYQKNSLHGPRTRGGTGRKSRGLGKAIILLFWCNCSHKQGKRQECLTNKYIQTDFVGNVFFLKNMLGMLRVKKQFQQMNRRGQKCL